MLPPLIRSRSLRLSGTACTRTRTSPASGSGTGTVSRRSTAVGRGPYSWVRHARIDSVMRRYVTDRGPALRRGPDALPVVTSGWDDYLIDVLLKVVLENATLKHHPAFGVASDLTVDFFPLPRPAVYVDTNVALILVVVTFVTVSTFDVVVV